MTEDLAINPDNDQTENIKTRFISALTCFNYVSSVPLVVL